jgi:hypothetical protein
LLWQATSVRKGGFVPSPGRVPIGGVVEPPQSAVLRELDAFDTGERRFGTGPPVGVGPPAEKKRSEGPFPSNVPLSPANPVVA